MAGGLFVYWSSSNGVLGPESATGSNLIATLSASGGAAGPASAAFIGDLCSDGAVPINTAHNVNHAASQKICKIPT